MARARRDDNGQILIWCPADGHLHTIDPHRWTFSSDYERPTFTPSLLLWHDGYPAEGIPAYRCHSFITDGRIQYLSDCSHSMAGQTVDLPDHFGSRDGA